MMRLESENGVGGGPVSDTEAVILRVKTGGLSCWSDGFRSNGRHLISLSMFGPRNSVRACWASLSERHHASVELAGTHLSREKDVHYLSLSAPIGHQLVHLMILHPDATEQISPYADRFFLLSQRPEETFFPRLNRLCRVPFRRTWAPVLWQVGVEAELITPLPGHGLPGYLVNADTDAWKTATMTAVQKGRLQ